MQAAVEAAYWENMNADIAALAALPPTDNVTSIVILDTDLNPRKFLWDYFLPQYTCPQKEKVGVMPVGSPRRNAQFCVGFARI